MNDCCVVCGDDSLERDDDEVCLACQPCPECGGDCGLDYCGNA